MKTSMRTRFRRGLILISALSLSLAVSAQKKADFSGEWKLNEEKSKLRMEYSFPPSSVTIEQDKAKLVYSSVGDFQGTVIEQTNTYNLDGSDSMNEGWQGTQTTSNASWSDDGKSLQVVTRVEMQDGNELKVIMDLSNDGKSLVIDVSMEGPFDIEPETWVFDKG